MIKSVKSWASRVMAALAVTAMVVTGVLMTPTIAMADTAQVTVIAPSNKDAQPTHLPMSSSSSNQVQTYIIDNSLSITDKRTNSITVNVGDTVNFQTRWAAYSDTSSVYNTYRITSSYYKSIIYSTLANTPSISSYIADGMEFSGTPSVYFKPDNATYSTAGTTIDPKYYTITQNGNQLTVTINNYIDLCAAYPSFSSASIIYIDFSAKVTTSVIDVTINSTNSGTQIITLESGSKISSESFPSDPSYSNGNVFDGWQITYSDGSTSDVLTRDEVLEMSFSEAVTINEVWRNYVTIYQLSEAGATNNGSQQVLGTMTPGTKISGSSITISDPTETRVGYTFAGWRITYMDDGWVQGSSNNDASTGTVYTSEQIRDWAIPGYDGITEDIGLSEVWTETNFTVTVTDGTNTSYISVPAYGSIPSESAISDPEAPSSDQEFKGWLLTINGTEYGTITSAQANSMTFSADATLTASFAEKDNSGTTDPEITYVVVTLPNNISVLVKGSTLYEGTVPDDPVSNNPSLEFAGWVIELADGTEVGPLSKDELAAYEFEQSANVTDSWQTVNVTVTLPDGTKVNGEEVSETTFEIGRGTNLTNANMVPDAPENTIVDGKRFLGWKVTFTTDEGTTETETLSRSDLALLAITSNATISEVWEDVPSTVSVTVPSGTSTVTYDVAFGETLSEDQIPSQVYFPKGYQDAYNVWSSYYEFDSWTVTFSDGTESITGLTTAQLKELTFERDATVIGVWKAKELSRTDVLLYPDSADGTVGKSTGYRVGEDFNTQSAADVANSDYSSHLVTGTSGGATVNMFDYYMTDENGNEVKPYALRSYRSQSVVSTDNPDGVITSADRTWGWLVGYFGGINGDLAGRWSTGYNGGLQNYDGDLSSSENPSFGGYYRSSSTAAMTFGTNGLFSGERSNNDNGSHAPTSGLVTSTLDSYGFPVLNGSSNYQYYNSRINEAGSGMGHGSDTRYLFDPTYTDSLTQYRRTYTDVQGLFQQDSEGYYYYNSQLNFAQIYQAGSTNRFALYDTAAVNVVTGEESIARNGQFYPFNTASEVFVVNSDGSLSARSFDTNQEDAYESVGPKTDKLNHHFGMTMEVPFTQEKDGYLYGVESNGNVRYMFSGDDDVYIYIDGVLVADGGGVHEVVDITIDFHTGEVLISNASGEMTLVTTIREAFENAGALTWASTGTTLPTSGNFALVTSDGRALTVDSNGKMSLTSGSVLDSSNQISSGDVDSSYKWSFDGSSLQSVSNGGYAAMTDRNGNATSTNNAWWVYMTSSGSAVTMDSEGHLMVGGRYVKYQDGEIQLDDNVSANVLTFSVYQQDESAWEGDTFADYTDHTLKMFYMERGASDSNLSLRYNLRELPETTEVAGRKVVMDGEVAEGFVTPGTYSFVMSQLTGPTTVASQTVTADSEGVFNFKMVYENAGTYSYEIREVIPVDAVNAAGTKYGDATDEEKRKGGFVKDGVVYDNSVYTVTHEVTTYTHGGTTEYEIASTTITKTTYDSNGNPTITEIDATRPKVSFTNYRSRVTVIKTWDVGTTPQDVEVQLYENGEPSTRSDAIQTLSRSNNWSYTWKNTDPTVSYTVRELTTGAFVAVEDSVADAWELTDAFQLYAKDSDGNNTSTLANSAVTMTITVDGVEKYLIADGDELGLADVTYDKNGDAIAPPEAAVWDVTPTNKGDGTPWDGDKVTLTNRATGQKIAVSSDGSRRLVLVDGSVNVSDSTEAANAGVLRGSETFAMVANQAHVLWIGGGNGVFRWTNGAAYSDTSSSWSNTYTAVQLRQETTVAKQDSSAASGYIYLENEYSEESFDLPFTGGTGIFGFVLVGTALLGLSVAIVAIRANRRNHRGGHFA